MSDATSPLASAAGLPRTALSQGRAGFPELSARFLKEYLDKIRLAVAGLDEEGIWWRPAPGTNSAGNLMLHLSGNLTLWILVAVAGERHERRRSEEFRADRTATKEELLGKLGATVERAAEVVAGLDAAALARPVAVQGYDTDVLAAVFHAVEHMAYHTGQIVWIVKQIGREPLEFYPRHAGE